MFSYALSHRHLFDILNTEEQKLPTGLRILVHATSKLTVEPITFVIQIGITF